MSIARNQLPTIKINIAPIKPYPHQVAAIKDALKEFKKADRATVIMPCATGKTLVCLWIAERLKIKTVVVFLPSLALIHQTAMEWAKVASKPLKLMAICSDQTVALDEDGIIVEKDEFWFPVLSNAAEITDFLNEPINSKEMKVVFCTYQSSFTLSEAVGSFTFGLGCFDEAHRSAVNGESYFSAPLFDDYIAISKRLFVTATPKQYSLAKKDEQDDFATILSMDNEEIYGKHCHVLSFRKAIEQDIISDYKIIFPEVTSDMVAQEMQLREGTDLPENAVYSAAMQIALKKAIHVTQASKVITFHARVKGAEQFAESLKQNNVIRGCHVYHVNGKQGSGTRKAIMSDFENQAKSLITNARCLTEGIDAPSVDMIWLLSNKKSKIDIIQAIGRALRKHPGKQFGYIMVPVFVNTAAGETYEDALAKPETQGLFELLLALEQHDELLCEAIRQCKFNEGGGVEQNHELLDKFFEATAQKYLSSDSFKRALAVAIVDRLGSNWDLMYGSLVKFKEKHGHCLVPDNYKDDIKLGTWVGTQRGMYKKGRLSQSKIDKLDAIGFVWDPIAAAWEEMYQRLVVFHKRHGHCLVPDNYKDDIKLGTWVGKQRGMYKKGRLSQDRIGKLDAIRFVWDPNDDAWEEMYQRLVVFHKRHGHCLVPNNYKDDIKLGTWVGKQRWWYKKGGLSQSRIDKLNALGFCWEVKK